MNVSPVHTHCWDAVGMITDLVEVVEILVFKADVVEMVLLAVVSVITGVIVSAKIVVSPFSFFIVFNAVFFVEVVDFSVISSVDSVTGDDMLGGGFDIIDVPFCLLLGVVVVSGSFVANRLAVVNVVEDDDGAVIKLSSKMVLPRVRRGVRMMGYK